MSEVPLHIYHKRRGCMGSVPGVGRGLGFGVYAILDVAVVDMVVSA